MDIEPLLDLNTATELALSALVGRARAAAIRSWREQHGPFGALDQVLDVPGIGSATLAALRGRAVPLTPDTLRPLVYLAHDGVLDAVDLPTGRRTGRLALPAAAREMEGDRLLLTDGSLLRIDPRSLEILDREACPGGTGLLPGGLVVGEDAAGVWVAGPGWRRAGMRLRPLVHAGLLWVMEDGELLGLDPLSGEPNQSLLPDDPVVELIGVPGEATPRLRTGSGAILTIGGEAIAAPPGPIAVIGGTALIADRWQIVDVGLQDGRLCDPIGLGGEILALVADSLSGLAFATVASEGTRRLWVRDGLWREAFTGVDLALPGGFGVPAARRESHRLRVRSTGRAADLRVYSHLDGGGFAAFAAAQAHVPAGATVELELPLVGVGAFCWRASASQPVRIEHLVAGEPRAVAAPAARWSLPAGEELVLFNPGSATLDLDVGGAPLRLHGRERRRLRSAVTELTAPAPILAARGPTLELEGLQLCGQGGWSIPETDARLDLGIADAEALATLPGIGPALAAAIVAERERRGGFEDVAELLAVDGVGPAGLARIEPLLKVNKPGLGPGEGVGNARAPAILDSPGCPRVSGEQDFVDPRSGALTLRQVDLVLEGRAGLSLEIARIYQPRVAVQAAMARDREDDPTELDDGIADGWFFDLPRVLGRRLHAGRGVFLAIPAEFSVFEPPGERLILRRITNVLDGDRVAVWELEEAFRTWFLDARGLPIGLVSSSLLNRIDLRWVEDRLVEVSASPGNRVVLSWADRRLATMVQEPIRRELIFFGGYDGSGRQILLDAVVEGEGRTSLQHEPIRLQEEPELQVRLLSGVTLRAGGQLELWMEATPGDPAAPRVSARRHLGRALSYRGEAARPRPHLSQSWRYELLSPTQCRTVVALSKAREVLSFERRVLGDTRAWCLVARGTWPLAQDIEDPAQALRHERYELDPASGRVMKTVETRRGSLALQSTFAYESPTARWGRPVYIDRVDGTGEIRFISSYRFTDHPDIPSEIGSDELGDRAIEFAPREAWSTANRLVAAVTLDPKGLALRTSYQWDSFGNQTRMEDPHGVVETRAYASAWGLEQAALRERRVRGGGEERLWRYEPDPLTGRLLSETTPEGVQRRYGYPEDPACAVVTETVGEAVSERRYDPVADLETHVAARGVNTDIQGDGLGGVAWRERYSPQSRRRYWSWPDDTGCVAAMGAPGLVPLILSHDALGRPLSERRADGTGLDYSYDDQFCERTVLGMSLWAERVQITTVAPASMPSRGLVEHYFDALGRLVATRRQAGEALWLEEVRHHLPGRKLVIRTTDGEPTVSVTDALGRPKESVDAAGGITTWTHHPNGEVASRTDPDGRTLQWRLSGLGQPISVEDAAKRRWSRWSDPALRERYARQPDGSTWTEHLDATGQRDWLKGPKIGQIFLTRTRDEEDWGWTEIETEPDGRVIERRFNAFGSLEEVVEAGHRVIRHSYDEAERELRRELPDGSAWTWTYDNMGRKITETDPFGATTTWSYDAAGEVISETNAWGGRTEIRRDLAGRIEAVLPPESEGQLSRALRTRWDGEGRPLEITDADGARRTFAYEPKARAMRVTDGQGRDTRVSFTPGGDLASVEGAEGSTTWSYDTAGDLSEVQSPGGESMKLSWDAAGRPQRLEAGGRAVSWTWSEEHRIDAARDEHGAGVRLERDALARPTGVKTLREGGEDAVVTVDWTGGVPRVATGGGGRLECVAEAGAVRLSDAEGHTWQASFDALNRLRSSVDPQGRSATIVYGADRSVSFRSPNGVTWKWRYDQPSRAILVDVPELGTFRTRVSTTGRPVSLRTPNGRTWCYLWDAEGRVAGCLPPQDDGAPALPDSGTAPAAEDYLGNARAWLTLRDQRGLIQTFGPGGAFRAYRVGGLLRRITGPKGFLVDYTWDAMGRLESLTRDGQTQRFTRDSAGRVTRTEDDRPSSVSRDYDDEGRLARRTIPNRLEIRYERAENLRRIIANEVTLEIEEQGDQRVHRIRRTDGAPSKQVLTMRLDAQGRIVELQAGQPFARGYYDPSSHSPMARCFPPADARFFYDAEGRIVVREWRSVVTPLVGWDGLTMPRPDAMALSWTTERYDYDEIGLRRRVWTSPSSYRATGFDGEANPTALWDMFTDGRSAKFVEGYGFYPDQRIQRLNSTTIPTNPDDGSVSALRYLQSAGPLLQWRDVALEWSGNGLLNAASPLDSQGRAVEAERQPIDRDALGRPLRWGAFAPDPMNGELQRGEVRALTWDLDAVLMMEHEKRWTQQLDRSRPPTVQRQYRTRVFLVPDEVGRPVMAIREPVDDERMPWEDPDKPPAREVYLLVRDGEDVVTHWVNEHGMAYPADEMTRYESDPPNPSMESQTTEHDAEGRSTGLARSRSGWGNAPGLLGPLVGRRVQLPFGLSEDRGELRSAALPQPLWPRAAMPWVLDRVDPNRYFTATGAPPDPFRGLWGVPTPTDLLDGPDDVPLPVFDGLDWETWGRGLVANAAFSFGLAVAISGVGGLAGLGAAWLLGAGIGAWFSYEGRTESYQQLTGQEMSGWQSATAVAYDMLPVPVSDLYALFAGADINTGQAYTGRAKVQLALGLLVDKAFGRYVRDPVAERMQTHVQLATQKKMDKQTAQYFSRYFLRYGGMHEGGYAPNFDLDGLDRRFLPEALLRRTQRFAVTPENPLPTYRRALTLHDAVAVSGRKGLLSARFYCFWARDKAREVAGLGKNYWANLRRSDTEPAGAFLPEKRKHPGDMDTALRSTPAAGDESIPRRFFQGLEHVEDRSLRRRLALTHKMNAELARLNRRPGAVYLDPTYDPAHGVVHGLLGWVWKDFNGLGDDITAVELTRAPRAFVKNGKRIDNRRPYSLAPEFYPINAKLRLPKTLGELPVVGGVLGQLGVLASADEEVAVMGSVLGLAWLLQPSLRDRYTVDDEDE